MLVFAGLVSTAIVLASSALGATRAASIGNFWYEDDSTRDRTKIVVQRGDQIVFTVREGVYPPHTVDVDELNIHSPGLLLGETYTTPPLSKVGNFKLYCRPHEARGHFTRLVVQAPAAATAAPARTPGASPTTAPAAAGKAAGQATPTPLVASPTATLAPVGVGKAAPSDIRRTVAADPDSLDALIGREPSSEPWTRALWLALIATVPIVAAAGYTLWRNARLSAATDSAPLPPDRPRSTKRSPRSSSPKASASARKSSGRRR